MGRPFALREGFSGQRLFVGLAGTPRLAASTGQVVPGGDVVGGIGNPSVNEQGWVAFVSDSSGERLLFADQEDGLQRIAKTGTQAPGLAVDVQFAQLPRQPLINRHGQVAFEAELAGPGIDPTMARSFWVHDPACGPVLLAREGVDLDFGQGSPRTIAEFDLLYGMADWASSNDSFSNQNGRNQLFNDRGELVYLVGFADGSFAVVVSQLRPWFFADGFESGSSSNWSSSAP